MCDNAQCFSGFEHDPLVYYQHQRIGENEASKVYKIFIRCESQLVYQKLPY